MVIVCQVLSYILRKMWMCLRPLKSSHSVEKKAGVGWGEETKQNQARTLNEAQTMGFRNSQERPVKNRRTNLAWLNWRQSLTLWYLHDPSRLYTAPWERCEKNTGLDATLMAVILWLVAVIIYAPGKLQKTNTQITNILSDSFFTFWGVYSSAGKLINLSKKYRDVMKRPLWPSKHSWRAQQDHLGKPMTSSQYGFGLSISTWSNAARYTLIIKRGTEERKISSHYCCRGISPARKECSLWRAGRGFCKGTAYKALCDLKAWNNLNSKLKVLKQQQQQKTLTHSYLPPQPEFWIRFGIKQKSPCVWASICYQKPDHSFRNSWQMLLFFFPVLFTVWNWSWRAFRF